MGMRDKGSERGIEPIASVLSDLIALRGLARYRSQEQLEEAWRTAAGEMIARYTRVGGLKRGVLEILVSHSALMQELANFRKQELLEKLRSSAETEEIKDLKFRPDESD